MSAKAIREFHGKRLVSKWISEYGDYDIENRCVQVGCKCSNLRAAQNPLMRVNIAHTEHGEPGPLGTVFG